MLSDKDIREALSSHLKNRVPSGGKIREELPMHNGNVIADVLSISSAMHVYEIKGDRDKISRLEKQSAFYNKVSPRLTLVTTERHLKNAIKTTPNYWGILVADRKDQVVRLRYERGAKNNPDYSKELALLTLWKDELLAISEAIGARNIKKKMSREDIASLLANLLTKKEVIMAVSRSLLYRN
jgi:hypothetical protein